MIMAAVIMMRMIGLVMVIVMMLSALLSELMAVAFC